MVSEEIDDSDPMLHIHGQRGWHDDVYIIGNKKGLAMLKEAIDAALHGTDFPVVVYCGDGEGYEIHVVSRQDRWDDRLLPYTEDVAKDGRTNVILPWKPDGYASVIIVPSGKYGEKEDVKINWIGKRKHPDDEQS
jgi:hypothetical protein